MRKWISNRLRSYTPDGRFWLVVGFGALIVDMAIGYSAGRAQATVWHGIGGALLAAGFAFLPDAAYEEAEHKRPFAAGLIALICIPIGIKAYEQQLTYTAGMRHGEMTGVRQVNDRKDSSTKSVKDNEALVALLNKQLASLIEANAWAPSVTASALRDELKIINDKLAREEQGQRGRAKGKGKEYDRLQDQAKEINAKIGVAENREDLTKRIDAANRALAAARETNDKREVGTSLNVAVAETTTAIVNLLWGQNPEEAMKASDVSLRYATIGSAGLGSLALLLLAPVGFFLAGRRRIAGFDAADMAPNVSEHEAATPPPAAPLMKATPAPTQTVIQRLDGLVATRNPETLGIVQRKVIAA